jgi:hypothetical protein
MANPNIVNVTSITGSTFIGALTSTLTTVLLSCATSSGQVKKIEGLIISNVNATLNASVTIAYAPNDDGTGTAIKIANLINVPALSSLQLLDKNSTLYLTEDTAIIGGASTTPILEYLISFETIA